MEEFNKIIFIISSSLLIPVIVVLTLMFIYALFHIGTFFGNYTDRTRFTKNIKPMLQDMDAHTQEVEGMKNHKHLLSRYLYLLQSSGWDVLHSEKLLSDFELDFQKKLEKQKILMRMGPMLGLMGTLIPMGPALAGLASGDIASMAINMQLAFSTTVIGIFIGLTGFILFEVQKRWAAEDFSEMEYLIQQKTQKQ